MEIDITSLAQLDCFPLSHSRMEGGENAGRDTWNASKEQAKETALLDTPEKLEAMREFAYESGGWSLEEIAEWDAQEINALFLQWIAGDVRQLPGKLDGVQFRQWKGPWYVREDSTLYGPYGERWEAYEAHSPQRAPRAESLDEVDWMQARYEQEFGNAPGNLSDGDDGKIYFYLGN